MRSFIIYLNFVSLLAVCLFACNHHSSNPMLQQVDSLLEMKPDSALTILKNISVLEDLPEVDKAYYALLLAEATDKNKLPLLPCDSLLNFALDYYGDDDREKAVALMYKGRLLAQMNDEMSAIEHNLKALEVLQNYPQDLKCRRLIYSMLGGMVIVNCTTRRWKYKIKLFFILLVLKILLLPIITLDIFMV